MIEALVRIDASVLYPSQLPMVESVPRFLACPDFEITDRFRYSRPVMQCGQSSFHPGFGSSHSNCSALKPAIGRRPIQRPKLGRERTIRFWPISRQNGQPRTGWNLSHCKALPAHDLTPHAHGPRKTTPAGPWAWGNLPLLGHDLACAGPGQGGNRRGSAGPRAVPRRGRQRYV